MTETRFSRLPLSWAHIACAAAYLTSLPLAAADLLLALVPLSLFVIISLSAPFFPRCGWYLPVISRGKRGSGMVAITFDDGPDPAVTPLVLALLKKYGVKAAFFPEGHRAERHPDLIQAILEQGHEVGNHTYRHTPMVMVQGTATLRRDIDAAQEIFIRHGIYPLAFRPPAGITNPKLWPLLIPRGMYCCNFSRRAGDMGNRRIGNIAGSILPRLKGGDIVLLHDVVPQEQGQSHYLLCQFEAILSAIQEKGLAAVPLGRLIGRLVMMPVNPAENLQETAARITAERALALIVPGAVPFENMAAIQSRVMENPGTALIIGAPGDLPGDSPLLKRGDRMELTAFIQRLSGTSPGSGIKRYDSIILTAPFPAHLADGAAFFKSIRQSLAPHGAFLCALPRPSMANLLRAIPFAMKWGLFPAYPGKKRLSKTLRETGFTSILLENSGRGFALTATLGDKDTLMESLIFS